MGDKLTKEEANNEIFAFISDSFKNGEMQRGMDGATIYYNEKTIEKLNKIIDRIQPDNTELIALLGDFDCECVGVHEVDDITRCAKCKMLKILEWGG